MPRLGTFQEKQKTCQTKVWRSLVFPARSQSFFLCVLYAFRVNPVFLRHANLKVGVSIDTPNRSWRSQRGRPTGSRPHEKKGRLRPDDYNDKNRARFWPFFLALRQFTRRT